MSTQTSESLVQRLSRSKIYRDYEKAFSTATGMPLSLRPVEIWNMAHRGKKNQNPFCALLAQSNKGCAACLEAQKKISNTATSKIQSAFCFAGLCDATIPVQAEGRIIGFLQTGQIALKKPSKKQFSRVAQQLLNWGAQVDLKKLEEAYFNSQVLKPEQYKSMLKLLEVFALHLSTLSNQLAVQKTNAEPVMIQKARNYIKEHQAQPLSLRDMSKALNVSTFYFCKMFKKATGLNFTDYLSRVRVEKAKNLLINPNLRVSEIAFEAGFQSLNHFNRVFRKITGKAPTLYRKTLQKNAA